MSRKYEKVQKLLPEVKRLNAEGYTHRQIAEKLGLGGKPEAGTTTMLSAWMFRQRICRLPSLFENVRSSAAAPTAIAECIFGWSETVCTETQKQCLEL